MSAAQPPSYRLIGIGLALAGMAAFSCRPILIKLAYGYGVDAITLLALRMIFSAPFFIAAALWARTREHMRPVSRRDGWYVLLLGFLGFYLASYLDFLGLQYINASLGRLLMFIYPTMVVMLSWTFLRKPARRAEVMALLLTYAGIVLVMSNSTSESGDNVALGAALVFASAFSYAVYLVIGGQVVARIGSVRFTAYAMSVACALCIVQFAAIRPLSALALPPEVYGLSMVMAIGATVLPVFMASEALKRIGANQFAIIGSVGPVTTVVFGYFGLEESMTALQLLGGALIVFGVVLVSLKPKPS